MEKEKKKSEWGGLILILTIALIGWAGGYFAGYVRFRDELAPDAIQSPLETMAYCKVKIAELRNIEGEAMDEMMARIKELRDATDGAETPDAD